VQEQEQERDVGAQEERDAGVKPAPIFDAVLDEALQGLDVKYWKQADMVPTKVLQRAKVLLVGVGAVGRQVAIQLAAMGALDVTIVDFDTVDDSNVVTQGFRVADVGKPKVEVVAAAMAEINPECHVTVCCEPYDPEKHGVRDVVLSCVDKMTPRIQLCEAVRSNFKPGGPDGESCHFFSDTRMLGELLFVLSASTEQQLETYSKTLFPDEEMEQGRCTQHATVYMGALCAGMQLHQVARWLRGIPVVADLMVDLMATCMVEDQCYRVTE